MYKTTLTQPGPMIDGRTLMPGTTLVTKAPPPSHWERFGDIQNAEQPATEPAKTFVVNPAPAEETGPDIEEMRADYRELTGEEPDKRWGAKKLREKLEDLVDGS